MELKSELLIIGLLLVVTLITAKALEGADINTFAHWVLLHS